MTPLDRPRAVFFNLFQIRFPVTAIVSIGHRVSGVFLALLLPVALYALHRSLASAEDFAAISALLARGWARVVVVLAIWALAHHVLAGIRHLLLDLHLGFGLSAARSSAWTVFVLEAATVLFAIGALA